MRKKDLQMKLIEMFMEGQCNINKTNREALDAMTKEIQELYDILMKMSVK